MDVTAHTAPSQQAVSLPLQGMEVWMNRHQIEQFGFSFQFSNNMIRAPLSQKPTDPPPHPATSAPCDL